MIIAGITGDVTGISLTHVILNQVGGSIGGEEKSGRGILVRLRYNTVPAKRQELSTYIVERLVRDFGKEYPNVRFATPSQTIRYRPDVGIDTPLPQA